MSLLFCDNFGSYGVNEALLLDRTYAAQAVTFVPDPDPAGTGEIVPLFQGVFNNLVKVFDQGPQAVIGTAFRIYFAALPTGFAHVLQYNDDNTTSADKLAISVVIDSNGYIKVYRPRLETGVGGNPTNLPIAETLVPVIFASSWQHIEVKIVAGNTDDPGSVKVRVEGVTVIDVDGVTTAGRTEISPGVFRDAHYTRVKIASTNQTQVDGVAVMYVRDFVLWNTGGTINNDFFGTVSVVRLIPNSDSGALNWTPSTGTTGFNLINESPPDDDADYIYATDPPPADAVFNLSNLPVDVTSVRGLQIYSRVKKTDGGDGNFQASLISEASTADGADNPVSTAYGYYSDIIETNPATGLQWSPVAVDSARLQLSRTL